MSTTKDPNGGHNSEDSIDRFRDNLADNQCSDVSPEADSPILSPLNTLSITEHKVIASQEFRIIVFGGMNGNTVPTLSTASAMICRNYCCLISHSKTSFGSNVFPNSGQRLVFNKVIHIENVSSIKQFKYFTDNHLKTVLQKCHNLKTIQLYVNSETVSSLSLLSDNCHIFKSIKLYVVKEVSSKALTEFCQMFGTKVEEIVVWDKSNEISILNWCPNLKILSGNGSIWLSLLGNQLVPTINTLYNVYIFWGQISAFVQLVDKYQNTIKKISVILNPSKEEYKVSEVLKQLSRLKNLESLRLTIQTSIVELDLMQDISYLCQQCPNLSMLSLTITPGFVQLSRPLKSSMSLKRLDIYCDDITENLFDIISDLVPNLKEFNFTSYGSNSYSNKHLTYLSRMKHLKRLVLTPNKRDHSTDDSAVIQLLDNCPKLIELKLNFQSNITVETIDKLKELANRRPKERIRFSTMFWGNESEDFWHSMNEIPSNLKINLIDEL